MKAAVLLLAVGCHGNVVTRCGPPPQQPALPETLRMDAQYALVPRELFGDWLAYRRLQDTWNACASR